MRWRLVVKCKRTGGFRRLVANLVDTALNPPPLHRWRHLRNGSGGRGPVGGIQGRTGKSVLDVRQQQFLVLLLMMQTYDDEIGDLGAAVRKKSRHCRIDMRSVV